MSLHLERSTSYQASQSCATPFRLPLLSHRTFPLPLERLASLILGSFLPTGACVGISRLVAAIGKCTRVPAHFRQPLGNHSCADVWAGSSVLVDILSSSPCSLDLCCMAGLRRMSCSRCSLEFRQGKSGKFLSPVRLEAILCTELRLSTT